MVAPVEDEENKAGGNKAFDELLDDVERIFEENFARIEEREQSKAKAAAKRPKIAVEDVDGELGRN